MVYDVATNKEMKTHIEHVVPASEQKTEAKFDNLKLSMELTNQQQISEVFEEIRSMIRDEMHHYMMAS